jgi:sigma-B regulation protein RsbU (phosphoserine phosphatase)
VLYTDGVTEAVNSAGEEYGRDRLERIVREGRSLSSRALIDMIYEDILRWTDGRGSHDDMTFFIVKANY